MTSPATLTPRFTAPPLALLATEPLRALFDFAAAKLGRRPQAVGDGHPVVVYPGLGGGALTTVHLRHFLRDCGFVAYDWQGGINTGPDGMFDPWLERLADRVRELHRSHGATVSLIGWSLGGVYAREVAKRCPQAVRQVITLGTPFSSMSSANHARTLYRLLGGDTSQLTPELEARLRECPPVPTTSIYSKADGIVAWRGCLEKESEFVENIEVGASHLGMGAHPEVLRIVVDRLAVPEGQWRLYQRGRRRAARRARVQRPASEAGLSPDKPVRADGSACQTT
jgi:pimeloyl-ACP methyl ester carboxylesterase